jgi:hypothetical protein
VKPSCAGGQPTSNGGELSPFKDCRKEKFRVYQAGIIEYPGGASECRGGRAKLKVVLVGGTSHAGKSTLARALAARLGGEALSTDQLGRHPGRPWRQGERDVPPHVAEHYGGLEPEALLDSVMRHYEGMWPGVRELIERRADDPTASPLVLEGSALLPSQVAEFRRPDVAALWLIGDDELLAARIRQESRFEAASAPERRLIAAFTERTWRYQRAILADLERLGLPRLAVGDEVGGDELAEHALALLAGS